MAVHSRERYLQWSCQVKQRGYSTMEGNLTLYKVQVKELYHKFQLGF
jgi:hypothetical protein